MTYFGPCQVICLKNMFSASGKYGRSNTLPYAKSLKLFFNQALMSNWLYSIQYNKDTVTCSSSTDNLK